MNLLHADADAFFASVEQASDPRLRGRPIAVGGQKRGVVASASYEARQFGITSAMPTARARRLCPDLIVVSGDYEKYERFSRWMFSYLYDVSPHVEITSIDEGYCDLSGCRVPPREVAERLSRAVRDNLKITVSEGLASNKLVAQIASKFQKPNGFVQVPDGRERAFLAPLRNRWLPGIGPVTGKRLDAAGLTHIRQIAETPVDHLRLLLGKSANTFQAFARGIDERPLVLTRPPAKSYSQQRTFETDQTDPVRIEAELRRIADELMARVRGAGKMIRSVTVKVCYNDMATDQAGETLREPTDLEEELYGRLRLLLRKAWRRRVSLRRISLKLARVYRGARQFELAFDPLATTYRQRKTIATTIDQLRGQRGRQVILRGHDFTLRDATRGQTSVPPTTSDQAPIHSDQAPSASCQAPTATFIPLRAHSHYSFLDSTLSVLDLVNLARRAGCSALALTDTANLHGAVPFAQTCHAAGIQPIFGAEFPLPGDNTLVLLVTDQTAYAALCRGISTFDPDGPLPSDLLPAHFPGISISNCPGLRPDYTFEDVAMPDIRYACPGDRLDYDIVQSIRTLSLLDHPHPDKHGVGVRPDTRPPHSPPAIPDSPFHFPSSSELAARFTPAQLAATHAIAERCRFGFDFGTLAFPGFTPPAGETPDAMLRRLVMAGFERRYGSRDSGRTRPSPTGQRHGPANTAQKRHATNADKSPIAPPTSSDPPGLNPEISPPHPLDQLEQELGMISAVGYAEYFLVVWDLLQRCARRGIEWITRGSAADSLVCYCLGISDVCPIRFKLYFKRFLNEERMLMNKLPDIDVDFPHDRKDEVVDLVFETFGESHAAVVGGFNTFQARSALGDVGKVLGMSEHQVRRITKRLPHFGHVRDLADIRQRRAGPNANPLLADLPLDEEPTATALRMAGFLDGVPRYRKMHPCGVVVAPRPIHEFTPTFLSAKGYPTTQFDMDAVEDIGLIKIDLLAQGGLSVMRDARSMIRRNHGVAVDLSELEPWQDPAVWDLISGGFARGVHHIESPAMISLARMCNTRDIDALVAQVSVIRPGAANESRKTVYARRYQGLEAVTYPHPSVIPCLEETYGVIAYEEQVMQICELFAGLDPGTSDQLRRALVKQKVEKLEALARAFATSATHKMGRSKIEIEDVWGFTIGFMGYAFNKAHSAAYAVEAYQAAWLKTYYPAEFMAGVLTHGKGFYRPLVYVLECHRLGLRFLPPCVNQPGPGFDALPDGSIRVPAVFIKGLRRATADRMTEHAPFTDLPDFFTRVRPDRDEALNLLNAGALDALAPRVRPGRYRPVATRAEDFVVREVDSRPEDRGLHTRARRPMVQGKTSSDSRPLTSDARHPKPAPRTALYWQLQWLFAQQPTDPNAPQLDMLPPPAVPAQPAVELTPPDRLTQLQHEAELLGFPASGHPLELHPDIAWNSYTLIAELGQHIGQRVTVCGLVIQQRIASQVNGELMKFMTICDWSGMVETELFAKTYREYGLVTVRYNVLEVHATVEPFENGRGHTLRIHRVAKPKQQP